VPSLTELKQGNLVYTTDYRRIYATAIQGWMGYEDPASILRGEFDPLPIV
jgi:hypothetical protein